RLGVLGVDVIVVPAAFTVPTGRVHWRPLLQARAIESLAYVVAAGQWGVHAGGRKTYVHSLDIVQMGAVLAVRSYVPGTDAADRARALSSAAAIACDRIARLCRCRGSMGRACRRTQDVWTFDGHRSVGRRPRGAPGGPWYRRGRTRYDRTRTPPPTVPGARA